MTHTPCTDLDCCVPCECESCPEAFAFIDGIGVCDCHQNCTKCEGTDLGECWHDFDDGLCDSCLSERYEDEIKEELEKTCETEANAIASCLKEKGIAYRVNRSGLSEAEYITFETETKEYEIRIAGHTARPSYQALNGEADFEVGTRINTPTDRAFPGNHQDSDGTYLDCLAWILKL